MGVNINIPDILRHPDASRLAQLFVDETHRTIWSIAEPEVRGGAKRPVMSKRQPPPIIIINVFLCIQIKKQITLEDEGIGILCFCGILDPATV